MANQLILLGPATKQQLANRALIPPGLTIQNGNLYVEKQGGLQGWIDQNANTIEHVAASVADAVTGGLATKALNLSQAVSLNQGSVSGAINSLAGNIATDLGAPPSVVIPGLIGLNDLEHGNYSGAIGAATVGIANATGLTGSTVENVFGAALNAVATATGISDDSTAGVISSIDKLLGASFEPLNKVAEEFASQAGISKKAVEATIEGNTKIAREIFAPAMSSSIQDPLTKINATIDAYSRPPKDALSDPKLISLTDPQDAQSVIDNIISILGKYSNETSMIGSLISTLWDCLKIITIVPATFESSKDEVRQAIMSQRPATRLDVASAITANIKGIIEDEDLYNELLAYGISRDRTDTLKELASQLLAPNDAIKAMQLGVLSSEQVDSELQKQGYNESHIQALKELASFLPNANDALSYFYRGLIDEKTLEFILTANGYSMDDIKLSKDGALSPVSPGGYANVYDRITSRDKGFFPTSFPMPAPQALKDVYRQNRLSVDQADIDFLAHWKDLPPSQWIEAHFRGFIDDDQMRLALSAQSIPAEAIDLLVKLQRPQLSIRYVTELLQTGGLSKEQAMAYLSSQGYDQVTIELILKYIDARIYGKLAETTDSLLQLSIGQAGEMFNDYLIDRNTYKQILIEHKYTEEAAEMLTRLMETKLQLANRKELAADIVGEFKLGNYDLMTATSKLHDLGFTQGQVDKYESQMIRAKALNSKLPSEGQLTQLLKKGKINEGLFIKQMESLGYSTLWAALIYELESGKTVTDESIQNTITETTGIYPTGGNAPKANSKFVAIQEGTPKDQPPVVSQ
jgi:hypothetical protein